MTISFLHLLLNLVWEPVFVKAFVRPQNRAHFAGSRILPLWLRPAVLPRPEPIPDLPGARFSRTGAGLSSCNFISWHLGLTI